MDMKLELIPLPVSDVDRATAFYTRLGFHLDVDVEPAPGVRVVQLTPPGSSCSIGFGTGLGAYDGAPGSIRALHLVVADIAEAREGLIALGIDVSDVTNHGGGVQSASFADPDGNTFVLQEMAWRTGTSF